MRQSLVAAALIVAALGVAFMAGRWHGAETTTARYEAAEAARIAAIAEITIDQAQRVSALTVELEQLRARPARVRTVTKEIRVDPDEHCRSLPAAVRQLWNAADGGAAAAAPAAGLVGTAVSGVAADGR